MSVVARIKQKSLFRKKLGIGDIIKLTNLSYGVCDESYRLDMGKVGEHTLLYDESNLARGIDVTFENHDILLCLNLPTTSFEIKKFYEVIEKICHVLHIDTYIREEENVSLTDNQKFIKCDEDASVGGLEDMRNKIVNEGYQRFELFGVYNPISFGVKEMEEIGSDLDKFQNFLHKLQSLDVYYAAPKVYEVNNKLVGIYVVGPDIPSVVPLEPYIVLNQIEGIEEWYYFNDGETVKYSDFLNSIKDREYYDVNHVIVKISEKDIASIVEKYAVEI